MLKYNNAISISVLYTLVIVGYPFVATVSAFLGQQSQIVSIVYRAIVLGVSFFLILSSFSIVSKSIDINPYKKYIFIFWAFYFTRIVLDTIVSPVVLNFGFKEYYLSTLGACFFPMVALMKPLRHKVLKLTCKFILVVGFVTLIFIWIIQIRSGLLHKGYDYWGGRLALETLNPILVGHLSVSIVIISLYSLIVKLKLYPKWVLWAVSVIGLVTTIASASKGPLLALLTVVFLFFITRTKSKFKVRHIILLIVIGAVMYQGAQFAEEQFGFSSVSRFQVSDDDRSTSGRLIVMEGAWNQFIANPVFGSSLEERTTLFYPHNVLLESFMATGVLGGSVFLLLIILSVVKSFKILKHDNINALLAMLYIQGLVGALLSGSLWGSGHMWVFMGAVFAVKLTKPVRVFRSHA